MPSLNEILMFFANLFRQLAKIALRKSENPSNGYRFKPKIYTISAFVDMDMRRLKAFVAEEIEAVAVPAEDRWHA
jgi:hypothetical protein